MYWLPPSQAAPVEQIGPPFCQALALTASESIAFAFLPSSRSHSQRVHASQQIMEQPKLVRDTTTPRLECRLLYDEFMRSMSTSLSCVAVTSPSISHHLANHMKDALTEHGPWRAYWCIWGEGFLQYLEALVRDGELQVRTSHGRHTLGRARCGALPQPAAHLLVFGHCVRNAMTVRAKTHSKRRDY